MIFKITNQENVRPKRAEKNHWKGVLGIFNRNLHSF